jgi:hypothetical protein
MDLKRLLIPIFLLACTPAISPEELATGTLRAGLATIGYFDPVAFGAEPGDGASDRSAVQAAVDAACAVGGGTVWVGVGRHEIDRAPDGSRNRFAAVSWNCDDITMRGAGRQSVLALIGDQGGTTTWAVSVDPSADNTRITELTVDLSAATGTTEQTHAIVTSGICDNGTCRPITNLGIDHIACINERNGSPERRGDCIRLLGNDEETKLVDARVEASDLRSDRSNIGINGIVERLAITGGNYYCERCDQNIDFESTGGRWLRGVSIAGVTIGSGPDAQGDYAVALSSIDGGAFTGNVLLNRGVQVYRTRGVVVAGNSIDAWMRTDDGVIDVANICEGTVIGVNSIRRRGAAGPLIKGAPHTTVPGGMVVAANGLDQPTAAPAILLEAVSRAAITANQVSYTGAPVPNAAAIHLRSTRPDAPVSTVGIAGNVVSGPVSRAVTIEAYPAAIGAGVSATGNVAVGAGLGLHLSAEGLGVFGAPITSNSNTMGASATGGHEVSGGD